MNINNYFDKIFCINLQKRTDRWNEMCRIFREQNLNVTRYNAVDGNIMGWTNERYTVKLSAFNGAMGCIASHLNLYKMAKQNNLKNILIMEDDCEFVPNLNQIFVERIKEVPDDWDLLYFGGFHETRGGQFMPEKISTNVVRAKRIITTTCYAVKNTVYDLIINTIEKDIPSPVTAIDGYLAAYIQPKCNTYAFHPPLAWQRGSFSDIQNGWRDYSKDMKNNNIK